MFIWPLLGVAILLGLALPAACLAFLVGQIRVIVDETPGEDIRLTPKTVRGVVWMVLVLAAFTCAEFDLAMTVSAYFHAVEITEPLW